MAERRNGRNGVGREPQQGEPRNERERRAVRTLIRGFGAVQQWSTRRDMAGFSEMDSLTGNMETLAGLLNVRTTLSHFGPAAGEDKTTLASTTKAMDIIMGSIEDSVSTNLQRLGVVEETRPQEAENIDSVLIHSEAFPLAIHDLRNRLTVINGCESTLRSVASAQAAVDRGDLDPSLLPSQADRLKLREVLDQSWGILDEMATESVEFLQDPGHTRPITLRETHAILGGTAAEQERLRSVKIRVVPLDEESAEHSIRFSRFVLRSLLSNAAQNAQRAAVRDEEIEEREATKMSVNVAVNPETNQGVIIIHDKAGGFSEDYLNRGITGRYTSARSQEESRGIALRALRSLVALAGGRIDMENDVFGDPAEDRTMAIGAKTTISLPLIPNGS